jgi:hypothetical protein
MGNKIRSAPISYSFSFSFWLGKKEGKKWKARRKKRVLMTNLIKS